MVTKRRTLFKRLKSIVGVNQVYWTKITIAIRMLIVDCSRLSCVIS